MNIISRVVVILCKIMALFIRALGMGSGATWPGEIALRLYPTILVQFAAHSKHIVLVAGTNGKTTTVRMIETILTHADKKVAHNASGANLDNGIMSAFLDDAGWDGKLRSDYFVFEVDEATLPKIISNIQYPISNKNQKTILVLMNLFRDQLDRYGEVDTIAEKWLTSLSVIPRSEYDEGSLANASSHLGQAKRFLDFARNDQINIILNADDPQLAYIGNKLNVPVSYFGLEDPSFYLSKIQHATDSIYCPQCEQRLTFGGVYYSHLGKWACGSCGFTHPKVDIDAHDFESPVVGVYNKYNTLATATVCRALGISDEIIKEGLVRFTPAFGRMETIVQDEKRIKILLSKNPTGFNESLRTALDAGAKTLLLVLNDRIPDGHDVSWIWDVDFEILADTDVKVVVSGDRCFDMGLRIKYALKSAKLKVESAKFRIEKSLNTAIEMSLKETGDGETLWILPTYSAMLDVRKILIGRKIL